MRIRLALLVILILSVVSIVPSIAADSHADRFALVIGNAKYPDAEAPLKEPINDARDVADELKRDGFSVEVGENLTGDAMRRAFDRLYGRIKPGSVVLIFFSGFGVQSARQSYLIPVDAQIWTEPDVRRDGFSLETVLGEINNRGAGVKIALIDASRRNPFERRFRSFSAGLAPVIAPNGTLVMYSAALSSVISDNGSDHSLFVQELLKEIRVPDLMAEETLNRTRVGVTRASRSEQVPWISSSLAEEFSFIPGSGAPPQSPGPQAMNPPQPTPEPKPTPRYEAPTPKPSELPTPPVDNQVEKKDEPPEKKDTTPLSEDATIKELNDRLAKNPEDANAFYRRGQVYASKGAYSLAVNDFSDSLRLNPKDVEAFNNRCWARTVIGDLQAALKDCNEALRLRPNFVDALDSRGLVNLKSGMAKNAIADFDAALKINPRLTSSLYGRGLAKQRNGSISEGDLDVSNAKAMDPNIVKEFQSYGVR
jgi:tetratricopeptide (TPR) repeat protein